MPRVFSSPRRRPLRHHAERESAKQGKQRAQGSLSATGRYKDLWNTCPATDSLMDWTLLWTSQPDQVWPAIACPSPEAITLIFMEDFPGSEGWKSLRHSCCWWREPSRSSSRFGAKRSILPSLLHTSLKEKKKHNPVHRNTLLPYICHFLASLLLQTALPLKQRSVMHWTKQAGNNSVLSHLSSWAPRTGIRDQEHSFRNGRECY